MQKYVVGFLFNYGIYEVVLIRKNRPDWQKGKLNGVGGKIEEGELPIDSMRREFLEEAGVYIFDWIPFCVLSGDNYEVHFFCASDSLNGVTSMLDEKVGIYQVYTTHDDYGGDAGVIGTNEIIPNLNWLIPMAINRLDGLDISTFVIKEIQESVV